MPVTRTSPVEEKISLFKSLFQGRPDVHARRFENTRTGKSGYSPVCANEWRRGVCDKPRIKCSACHHQAWLPLNDKVIEWHLRGTDSAGRPFVAGVYPMMEDETTRFLAVDFDGGSWQEDASEFLKSCQSLSVPATLERSRSGNGGHVWIFFSEPVPASVTRQMGAAILTATMERRPELGLKSYDRLFPNQDTLPKGGFGNLIALPLQKAARDRHNSEFIDENCVPYPDQWEHLGGVRRMSRMEVEAVVEGAERRGKVLGVRTAALDAEDDEARARPWKRSPSRMPKAPMPGTLHGRLTLVLADGVYVPTPDLPAAVRNAVIRLAAFQNPEFYRAQSMRMPVHRIPRIIGCAEVLPEYIALPRGCLTELVDLLKHCGAEVDIRDERHAGEPVAWKFVGSLRADQERAARAMAEHDTGVLAATTAFGKTVLAAWLVAKRGVSTLVVVHRQQLLNQWVDRLSQFLGIPESEIGVWSGEKKKLNGKLDVALIQSLSRKGTVHDMVATYGHVVLDECHHLPAVGFESVLRRAKAKYVTGLSATIARKDGHQPMIFMQCGPVRHRVDARGQAEQRPFSHEVIVRSTGFVPAGEPEENPRLEFQRICLAICSAVKRNEMIVGDVVAAVAEGRTPIVLTERTEHLELLSAAISGRVQPVVSLRGGMGRKQLKAAMDEIRNKPETTPRVIVATGRFVGEGFDDPRLDTLFLTMPVSWKGTLTQYAGRLHRLHAAKRVVRIHDYADFEVPMLARMFERRCDTYESLGYAISAPASAAAGWPEDVLLPADAKWKMDYGSSVRRLVADGVDPGLGQLFVSASRQAESDGNGAEDARSASEAFIFRRLETHRELAGRFRLNRLLPIPFDGQGTMEVDLVNESDRVAVEIDGNQHLGDADAYRRDRRKDLALQMHGWVVLRFLAVDLGKRLDAVLDSILFAVKRHRPKG